MIEERVQTPKEVFLQNLDIIENFTEDYEFNLVLPGDLISRGEGLIQGSGTYEQNEGIYSSLVGYVVKTNKLVSVKPLKSRYTARVGDIVVGRVKEIVDKRWKIDIGSHDKAQLHLNAVKLKEIQRRKTEEDERQMRQFLAEGDLVVAEVQSVSSKDKTISLHIRNNNFGKLEDGYLLHINHNLVKKQNRHMIDLSMGLKMILGLNGALWLEPIEKDDEAAYQKIAKIQNLLKIFEESFIAIRVPSLLSVYSAVSSHRASELLTDEVKSKVYDILAKIVNDASKESLGEILTSKID